MPTPAPKTATYKVAPGREVVHDGKPYVAGAELELPVDDGDRLKSLGFFVDEDGSVLVRTDGPAVIQGAEIREG